MKKTIFAVAMAALVSLFSVSCSKTDVNTSKLIGTWKLIAASSTSGSVTTAETITAYVTLQFVKGGVLNITETEGTHSVTFTGTWVVSEDTLIISSADNSTVFNTTYNIVTLDSKSLIVSATQAYSSTIYTTTYTFAKL